MPTPPDIRDKDAAAPSPWVVHWLEGVAAGGRVLDIACGSGRHLRLAHARGLRVTGIDRNLDGVADLAGAASVALIAADLEAGGAFPLVGETFDGVIVTNYLWRPILAEIVARVADDGVLIYETFARGQERLGRPSNPAFLLAPNELATAVLPRLAILAFEYTAIPGPRPRIVQRIAAVGPRHRWLEEPPDRASD